MAQRAQEREGHAAADHERVDLADQVLDERDLVRDLGAAEHGHQRPLRRLEDPPQRRQLSLHEQARRRRLQVARDGVDRRVRAVRGRERIVHVAVGQLRELAREAVVVLFLLGVEAEVLQQQQIAGLQRLGVRARRLADAVGRERHRSRQEWREPLGDGLQRVLRIRPALRPAEVGGEHDGGATVEREAQGGHRRPQARVVRHRAALEGDVEVGADEHALARQRQVLDRQLRHDQRVLPMNLMRSRTREE